MKPAPAVAAFAGLALLALFAASAHAADRPAATDDPYSSARDHYRRKAYRRAAGDALLALAKDPFDARAYYLLGASYEKLNDAERAVQAYDMCLMALPDENARSRDEKSVASRAASALRRLDKTGQPLRKAADTFLKEARTLADSYMAKGQYWQARRAWQMIVALQPADAEARKGLARARKALGEPALADRLDKALAAAQLRPIGSSGTNSPVDITIVSQIDTPEGAAPTPVAGIEIGRKLLRPERLDPGLFLVALHPRSGKVLGTETFLARDPVASGARVNLFVDRLPAGTIVAAASIGGLAEAPRILQQPLGRLGVPALPQGPARLIVFVGVKGARAGSALVQTGDQRAVVRLTEELEFRGPLDKGSISY
jgi:hypothetical protein